MIPVLHTNRFGAIKLFSPFQLGIDVLGNSLVSNDVIVQATGQKGNDKDLYPNTEELSAVAGKTDGATINTNVFRPFADDHARCPGVGKAQCEHSH